jgi:hypothetical protein
MFSKENLLDFILLHGDVRLLEILSSLPSVNLLINSSRNIKNAYIKCICSLPYVNVVLDLQALIACSPQSFESCGIRSFFFSFFSMVSFFFYYVQRVQFKVNYKTIYVASV